MEFHKFPSIPRLRRNVIVTEKIDGTNAQILIRREFFGTSLEHQGNKLPVVATVMDMTSIGDDDLPAYEFNLFAGSKNRWILPSMDNAGFAQWVVENRRTLAEDLGEGHHYGEWYGAGIQRRYGMREKRLALFNTKRWADAEFETLNLGVVPILAYHGTSLEDAVAEANETLLDNGSFVPGGEGFKDPEGVVAYHTAGNSLFKVTFDNDDAPKSIAANGVRSLAEYRKVKASKEAA